MAFKKTEEAEEFRKQVWQMNKDEVIHVLNNFPGNFEKKLNSERSHQFLIDRHNGNIPSCGMSWLRDAGVLGWYIHNQWIVVEKDASGKWQWALTERYCEEGIPLLEAALERLMELRDFAQKKEAIEIKETVKSMV